MVPGVVGSTPIIHPKDDQRPHNQGVDFRNSASAPTFGTSCAKFNLTKLNPQEEKYPFKAARLNDCNGDLKKRWYIEFYVWNVQKDSLVRKRTYDANHYTTSRERKRYAYRMIREINELLYEGYHIDVAKTVESGEEERKSFTLSEAVEYALEIKRPSIRETSYASYKSTKNKFLEWAKENRIATMDVAYFDKLRAIYFDDYLLVHCNYSARTINGDISYIKSFFQVLVDREIITNNPFQKLKKHKEASSRRNLALSKNQIKKIKEEIEEKDRQLWLFVQFIYYCYLRPNEVRQLTFQHIHLEKRQIFIPGHISKNGMDGYVTIPEVFARELKKSGIFKTDNEYIFQSKNGIKPVSKNVMGYRYRQLVKKLKLSRDYTLYSWKHSGVVSAYNAGVDIKTLQKQCRHQSLEQTDIYLKSLGLDENKAINKIPEL